jgi:hypothetical protein
MQKSKDIPGITLIARESLINLSNGTGIIKPNYEIKKNRKSNEFTMYFSKVFDIIDKLNWIFYFESFKVPMENDNWEDVLNIFETDLQYNGISSDGYFLYSKKDLFNKFGEYVRDDWNDMLGFDSEIEENLITNLNFKEQKSSNEGLINSVNTIFYNFDSYSWSCFTKNDNLLNIIVNENKKMDFIRIEETSFKKCFDGINRMFSI